MHRSLEQRRHAVGIEARSVGVVEPAVEPLAQGLKVTERDNRQACLDVSALPGPAGSETLVLELAVGLEHRVGIDRERGDDILDRGQLIAGRQCAETQSMLDLTDELLVGRDPRLGIEPERDRVRPFIYLHRERVTLRGSAVNPYE